MAAAHLNDVPRVLDTSICNDGHPELARTASAVEDCRGLASAHGADLLGGADGTGAHPDAQAIGTSLDQTLGLHDDGHGRGRE